MKLCNAILFLLLRTVLLLLQAQARVSLIEANQKRVLQRN
jgi:hypothetical protein